MANTNARQPTYMLAGRTPLRELRMSRGWTLAHTAAMAEMDVSHLSKAERGLAGLSVDTLARLARAFELIDLEQSLAPYTREAA